MTRLVPALALVGCLLGCGGGETESPPGEQAPAIGDAGQMELWKLELMLEDRASNNEIQSYGPSSYSTYFAPDGSVIRPGVGEIQGRDSIHAAFMADIYSNTLADLVWTPTRAEVSRSGDLGYTVGEYRALTVDSAGVRTSVGGMYVRLWSRQPDDSWKVDLEIGRPVTEPEVVGSPAPGNVP